MTGWANRTQRRPHVLSGKARTERTRRIIQRDHGLCCVCGQPGANQADHVTPLARGGADTDANLAAIHDRPCHQAKTQAEAAAGRAPRRRAPDPHPGFKA